MVAFTKHDLNFILDGISVSQSHAAQTNTVANNEWTTADLESSRQILLNLLPNSLQPIGMRTITGELNSLVIGQDQFGAADNEFPRLLDPDYRDGEFGTTYDPLAPPPPGSPPGTQPGDVVDTQPRIISNLIVDQSLNNPAAVDRAAYDPLTYDAGLDGIIGTSDDGGTENGSLVVDPNGTELDGDEFFFIENIAPDEGLTAPFNSFMTFFGQFFDHGLDLVAKGGAGTVFIPLMPDDPLFDPSSSTNFMVLTRATVSAGLDGVFGDDPLTAADESLDDTDAQNLTSPFVDQNQTYTSHPSHQIWVREYEFDNRVGSASAEPYATGRLLEGSGGGMATWGDVKAQALQMGFVLTDAEALNVPLFAVDQYGEFIAGANGFPQLVLDDGSLVEGDPTAPIEIINELVNGQAIAARTGFSFLVDIAHDANPVGDHDGNSATPNQMLLRHFDNNANDGNGPGIGEYDGDMLDAHFIAGDGRANENIALTAVHHVFHQEHNRVVEHTKEVLLSSVNNGDLGTTGDEDGTQAALDLLNGYLEVPVPTFPATQLEIDALVWDGDGLFQAAKFATEMQYQHLVFEEFGRKVQPLIDLFASFEPSIDASIVAEFAHTVYRFGHSMLTETVDLMAPDGTLTEAGLIEAFLNPLGFNHLVAADGTITDPQIALQDSSTAAGAIIRGMTRQAGNEIDEFVTGALRNNLLGLPLDLATINIARGRETGVPTLNDARAEFFAGTGDTKLKPYDSWLDFALHIQNEMSIVNFIAAYGQHTTILSATTLADKRAAAFDIVVQSGASPADRLDFLNSTGTWATQESGLNLVDFWIGGLAEAKEPFGGLLGSTFNFVFEEQMEDLQDGDRFYYLGRTAGLNFLSQLEQNSFAGMIIRNTDIGDLGGDHLPGDVFGTTDVILEVDQSLQITGLGPNGNDDPTGDSILIPLVQRADLDNDGDNDFLQLNGALHAVLGGTEEADIIIGGTDDDTIWGDGGDDTLEGGFGPDIILGGTGDDILTDVGGGANLQGQAGNDAIAAGAGENLILAGEGDDFVLQGPDLAETFGGQGNDFIHAGTESNIVFGNEGNDWLEGGGGNNLLVGDNGDPFLNSTAAGHDVFISGQGDDDYDSESGDDIMEGADGVQRFEGVNGFDWATYRNVEEGINADMLLRAFDETPIPPSNVTLQDRFDSVEGLSGSKGSDILRGSDQTRLIIDADNNGNDSVLRTDARFDLINGLRGTDNTFNIFQASVTEWGEGDIILGGRGSDLIEGRGGDDIIDGDLKLDVRISGTVQTDGGILVTARDMHGDLFNTFPDGSPDWDSPYTSPNGTSNLQQAIFARDINPGDLNIVREIIDESLATDFDTAEFSDVRAAYTIEESAPGVIGDADGDGFISVTHNVVVDGGGNAAANGTDNVRNIERLQFSDLSIDLAPDVNTLATGMPTIVDPNNGNALVVDTFVGQQLAVDATGIDDADGIATSVFAFFWQAEEAPGVWADLIVLGATGDDTPLQGSTITVPPEAEGLALRVRAIFQDDAGVFEQVFSDATSSVGSNLPGITINLGAGAQNFVGTAGADTINGQGGSDVIDGAGGNDTISGGGGADTIAGGDGNDDIRGNAGADTINGDAGDDAIRGNGGADIISGGLGVDTILGGGGADVISGDEGDDIINAGGALDTIEWRVGDGRDQVDGGNNGADLFSARGDGTLETWQVVSVADIGNPLVDAFNAANPTPAGTEIVLTRNGVIIADLQNVEELEIDTRDGGDTVGIIGSFDLTSLAINTITINGSDGDETIDISELDSAHRIVLRTNGGNDMIVGTLRPQDVVELAPGLTPADYDDPIYNDNNTWTVMQAGGGHSVTYVGGPNMATPTFAESTAVAGGFDYTLDDIRELKNIVRGLPSDNAEDHATGVRDLEGTGNNVANPHYGSADQEFIRLTEARYGEYNSAIGNHDINPIFNGLDPRTISNILGEQEPDLPTNAEEANILFMAFGQYFDHGLDFLPKTSENGTIGIGHDPNDDPADLTRGEVSSIVDGASEHLNKASPFVDQNQAYGSTELVGQFLRASDGSQGHGARLLAGAPDPSNPDYALLPTLRELILHHWEENTMFSDPVYLPAGPMSFREYFTDLPYEMTNPDGSTTMVPAGTLVSESVDASGATVYTVNEDMVPFVNADFMGSGHTLVGDANPFINLLDHYVAGDLRANENYSLTSIHTIWSRNHNHHVEALLESGFDGTPEELFQAAKIVNESEYQRVVFTEFADKLIGGIQGSGGDHGFDDYDPTVDARISHEFAAAAYRFGHSLIGQTMTVIDANGEPQQVPLTDIFLNPTNDDTAFTLPIEQLQQYGYTPQPGYEQVGVNGVIEGISGQPAEEVDYNIVDAVRDDLVRIRADLFAFNVARGWDVGLGTLNQVRADLLKSTDPYVGAAVDGVNADFTPYSSWEDFRARNGLSLSVMTQLMAAYPDLELQIPEEIAAFEAANPDTDLHGPGGNIVHGIDRLDLWVGGLAEAHTNGGMVGSTFWVILHEQLDRLQEGDRFYYLDRVDDFDFYEQVEDQTFADIIERNTGLQGLSDDIFSTSADDDNDNDGDTNGDDDDNNDGDTNDDGDTNGDGDDDVDSDGDTNDDGGGNTGNVDAPMYLVGTEFADGMISNGSDDTLLGLGGEDTLVAGGGNDTVGGGAGNDQIVSGAGNDIIFGNDGNDTLLGQGGDDFIEAGAGRDRILAGDGDDMINAGADRDYVDAGAGDDTVYAELNDGDDVINAGDGVDTYDLSIIEADIEADLGNGPFGRVISTESGVDVVSGFENITTGSGNDTITGNNAANTLIGGEGMDTFVFTSIEQADGDYIADFRPGDTIDLNGIASNYDFGGDGTFDLLAEGTTSFSQAGQLIVREDNGALIVDGNVDGDAEADFTIRVAGKSELNSDDFNGV